jgi:preprotein translocase subunit YajC
MDQFLNYALLALLAVMIFFMFRNSKKRKAEM